MKRTLLTAALALLSAGSALAGQCRLTVERLDDALAWAAKAPSAAAAARSRSCRCTPFPA